jgi:hypothetical protein
MRSFLGGPVRVSIDRLKEIIDTVNPRVIDNIIVHELGWSEYGPPEWYKIFIGCRMYMLQVSGLTVEETKDKWRRALEIFELSEVPVTVINLRATEGEV